MPNILQQQRRITLDELPVELPDFKSSYESKDSLIKKWFIKWLSSSIKNKKIKENDILPNKIEISKHLGVSVGTVQNAIRYVEDAGYLKSKQKLGTMVSNASNPIKAQIKSTSKRDKAIEAIKKELIIKNCKLGKSVPSTRKMSEYIQMSQNTTRLAYEYLCSQGILESRQTRGNDSNWILKQIPCVNQSDLYKRETNCSETLVQHITKNLKSYLSKNYKVGEKIPTNGEIAARLNVSIKTVHDSLEELINDGIIIARRGRYGSILAKDPCNNYISRNKTDEIFAIANDSEFYHYQKIEKQLINLINKEYNPGDKLPSMIELSEKYSVSTNTVRKALKSLSMDGFITFGRGRYGGTYVIDKPEYEDKAQYQWLAINPNYIE